MTDTRIARRYAQALFNFAKQRDMVQTVEQDLALLTRVVASDPKIYDFIVAPFTSREEKLRILGESFGDNMSALTLHVLRMMLDKQRETEIPGLYEQFRIIRQADRRVVQAEVTSAQPLDEDQRDRLVRSLAARLDRTVEARFAVDPSLIGGLRVAYESHVLDGTVRGSLSQLRERLRYDLLKQN